MYLKRLKINWEWIKSYFMVSLSFSDLHHLLSFAVCFSRIYWWVYKRRQVIHNSLHTADYTHCSYWLHLQYCGSSSWTLYHNLPSFHEIQVNAFCLSLPTTTIVYYLVWNHLKNFSATCASHCQNTSHSAYVACRLGLAISGDTK